MPSAFAFVSTMVLADVRRRQGVVLALALAATGYLWLWFPPPSLRASLHTAAPLLRAAWLLAAAAVYLRITAFASARALASSEVMHLRHLPVAASAWQRMHVVHLAALEWPLAAIAAYGLAPTWGHARVEAFAWWSAGVLATMAWRVVVLAARDRHAAVRVAITVAAAGLAGLVLVLGDAALALAIAVLAMAWAWRRLARPLPSARRGWTLPAIGRGPAGALVWLWLAMAWAHDRAAITLVAAIEALCIAAIALAWHHVGADASGNVEGAVALFCSLGAAPVVWLGLRNERRLALERHALDPLIGEPALELVARMLAACMLALPMSAAWLVLASFGVPLPGLAVPQTIAIVTLASGPAVLALSIHGQLHDRLQAPMVRAAAVVMAAQGLVLTGLGGLAALALAAGLAAWAWTRAPAAARVRQRRARVVLEGST